MRPVAPSDLERFRTLVSRRLGLHCTETGTAWLGDVLAARLASTHQDLDEYLSSLDSLRAIDARDEVAALAGYLTVPETHFFRQSQHQRVFDDLVLAAPAAARHGEALRILVAGCASGEEAYSIAMSVRARGLGGSSPSLPSRPVEIVAIDVSRAALVRARLARYSPWALRETPDAMRTRWFRREGRDWVLDPSIVAMVDFEERNLVDDDPTFWRAGRFDVVFCRNVLMYLAPESQIAVMAKLSRALRSHGVLFLGYAESVRGLSTAYETCNTHETFYYRRLASSPADADADGSLRTMGDDHGGRSAPPPAWMDAIERASARVLALSDRTREPGRRHDEAPADPSHRAPHPFANDAVRAFVEPASNPEEAAALLFEGAVLDCLSGQRLERASTIVETMPEALAASSTSLLLRAAVRMLRGDFELAASDCARVLAADPSDAGAHHVLALCAEGEDDLARAIEHDRAAARLDARFAMPRLRLGVLARRRGAFEEARRELVAALPLLATEDASRVLLFAGGFGREALVALCQAELAACAREVP